MENSDDGGVDQMMAEGNIIVIGDNEIGNSKRLFAEENVIEIGD